MNEADNLINLLISRQEYFCLGKLAEETNHTLKNLLMGIIGHTELDLKKNPETRLHKLILKNGYAAQKILKAVSEWQNRNTEKHVCGFPISESVDDVLELLDCLPEFKALDIQKKYETADLITANKCEISQAIFSILYKCMYACTPEDTIRIRLKTKSDRVLLQISDTAKGMTPDQADALFSACPPETNPPEETNGSRPNHTVPEFFVPARIIEKHNGRIDCKACPDHGTEYTLSFPLRQKVPFCTSNASEKKNVLIMEREEVVRDVISETLNSCGYQSFIAETMDHAEPMISAGEISLIILDFHYEVRENIRRTIQKIRGRAPQTPLLLMSCLILDSETLDQAKGISAFMQKPFEINSLRYLADVLTESPENRNINTR